MRFFLAFMRGPLWVKLLMVSVLVAGVLIARDGRAIDFAKEKFGAVTQTAAEQTLKTVAAKAAEQVGGDGFAALGLGDLVGETGGLASPGAKRAAQPRQRINWREIDYKALALEKIEYLKNNPLTAFMLLVALVAIKLIISGVADRLRLARERAAKRKKGFDQSQAVDSVLDTDVLNKSLDAAFENPNGTTNALRLDVQTVPGAGGGAPALRSTNPKTRSADRAKKSGLALAFKGQSAKRAPKPHTAKDQRLNAVFAQKLENDPFDRLEGIHGRVVGA